MYQTPAAWAEDFFFFFFFSLLSTRRDTPGPFIILPPYGHGQVPKVDHISIEVNSLNNG